MKFNDLYKKATDLFEQRVEIKFYEMVLCYSLEELFTNNDEIQLTEPQFQELLECMTDYLADCTHISAWDVADAITKVIDKHGIEKFIEDYDSGAKLLETALEEI